MYAQYLEAEIRRLKAQEDALRADAREDEAIFARIESNVCTICLTVYQVCRKTSAEVELANQYLQKLDALARSWENARDAARAHGDDCKAAIETIKLDALARNRARFCTLETE